MWLAVGGSVGAAGAPVVTGVVPPLLAPGVSYAVLGGGFAAGRVANVTFGGLPCGGVVVWSLGNLTCTFAPPGGVVAVQRAPGYPLLAVVVTSLDDGPSDGSLAAAAALSIVPTTVKWGDSFTLGIPGSGIWSPQPTAARVLDTQLGTWTVPWPLTSAGATTVAGVVASALDPALMPTELALELQWPDSTATQFPAGWFNVSFAPAQLAIVDPDTVLAAGGGSNVSVRLPRQPPAQCGGVVSVQVGGAAAPRWWVAGHAGVWIVTAAAPSASASGATAQALNRVTVVVCGAFSATSDGLAEGSAIPQPTSATIDWRNYVSYPIASAGGSMGGATPQVVGDVALANVTLAFGSTAMAVVAPWVTGAWLNGVPCGGVLSTATLVMCLAWPYSSAAGDSSGSGSAAVTLPVTIAWRGGAVVSLTQGVRVANLPLVDTVTPAAAAPGTVVTLMGSFLLSGPSTVVHVGAMRCAVQRQSPFALQVALPVSIPVAAPGYPVLPWNVTTAVGSNVARATVTIAVQLRLAVATPGGGLPNVTIVSDTAALSPAPLWIALQLVTASDGAPAGAYAAGTTCFLRIDAASPTPAQLVAADGTLATSVDAAPPSPVTGTVQFPPIRLRAPVPLAASGATAVTLMTACVNTAGVPVQGLRWNVSLLPLAVRVCGLPDTLQLAPQSRLPNIVATLGASCSAPATGEWVSWLPPVTCALEPAPGSSAAVSGGAVTAPSGMGWVVFNATVVASPPATAGLLQLSCAVGQLPLPLVSATAQPSWSVAVQLSVTGCEVGSAAVGPTCAKCTGALYGLGGGADRPCYSCPVRGAVCSGGVLQLQPDHYLANRSPAGAAPLTAASELHPCTAPGACVVNTSLPQTEASFSCAPGHGGVLCGVCAPGYAPSGSQCQRCTNLALAAATLALVLAVAVGVVAMKALETDRGTRSLASIALRIALAHMQALGSLRAFGALRPDAYSSALGWTSVFTTTPLGWGALRCLWQPGYLTGLLFVLLLPVAVPVAVLLAHAAIAAWRASSWAPATPRQRCGGRCPRFNAAAWWGTVAERWRGQHHVGTCVFVASFCYMAATTAAVEALQCIAPIGGVRYLTADLSVVCGSPTHIAAGVAAVVWLAIFTAGFPAAIVVAVARTAPQQMVRPAFRNSWGFVTDGYRLPAPDAGADDHVRTAQMPGRCRICVGRACWRGRTCAGRGGSALSSSAAWWEATVLARRAALAAISVLVAAPQLQLMIACLLLLANAGAHWRVKPYQSALLNRLEMGCLVALLVTVALGVSLLPVPLEVQAASGGLTPYLPGQDGASAAGFGRGVVWSAVVANVVVLAFAGAMWVAHTSRDLRAWWRAYKTATPAAGGEIGRRRRLQRLAPALGAVPRVKHPALAAALAAPPGLPPPPIDLRSVRARAPRGRGWCACSGGSSVWRSGSLYATAYRAGFAAMTVALAVAAAGLALVSSLLGLEGEGVDDATLGLLAGGDGDTLGGVGPAEVVAVAAAATGRTDAPPGLAGGMTGDRGRAPLVAAAAPG